MGTARLSTDLKIAIVGSGPAGLSAAAHAATKGVSHILLERADHINDTIFKYQKRKLVMATPDELPAQQGLELQFKQELREEVIDSWTKTAADTRANIRCNAEVTGVTGEQGNFRIALRGGETITAEYVILAVGTQGNIRRLDSPGADALCSDGTRPMVQYQLDDPEEYRGERIAVIGVGDAGLENALALAVSNEVYLINRKDEFLGAKEGNVKLIEKAFKIATEEGPEESGAIVHVTKVETREVRPGMLLLSTAEGGEGQVQCDRIIARIGTQPPRGFLKACGIEIVSEDRNALPPVSETYESEIKGLYIIGALGGYPLIKNCLNQGFEVVESILGNTVMPADEPLIQQKLTRDIIRALDPAATGMTGAELVEHIRARAPMFAELQPVQIRAFLIHSKLHYLQPDAIVFERGDHTDTLFTVLDGEVGIRVNQDDPNEMVRLGAGQFFGEMGLISGRIRSATVVATQPVLLLEVERNTILKLEGSHPAVKKTIDDAAVIRQIKSYLAPHIDEELLKEVVATSKIVPKKTGEVLIREGDTDDAVYLIRKGSVTISKRVGDKDVVLSYVAAGHYVGEMARLTRHPRMATVTAAIATEAIQIDSGVFRKLLDHDPELRRRVEDEIEKHNKDNEAMQRNADAGDLITFLVHQGAGEATDILLIDESLCIRCDNCEKACAETHHGISRLDREAGPTYATLHVPTSCRHCEDPHCMTDCPPDAIHRAPNGEVYIVFDQCIGCENCKNNCPYGVIQMAKMPPEKPPLWKWLLWGAGPGPGEDKSVKREGSAHAVKCDLCKDLAGPACVRACPTGAAIRVKPERFIEVMRTGQ